MARVLGENGSLHGASFPGTCTVLMGLLLVQLCPLSSSGLRDPAAAICTIPLSFFDELPKYTTRVLGGNGPLHGASFPGTYAVLVGLLLAQ